MDIIGQEKLVKSLKESNARAILVEGPPHAGKKTIIRKIYGEMGLYVYEVSGTVNDFRETLDFIRTQTNPIMYLIPDIDQLRPAIQNLLLKVLEEPPMKARFCLTASNTILPTIKSRCVTYTLDRYTPEQIMSICVDSERAQVQKYINIISKAVETPGQLEHLIGWQGYQALPDMIQQMSEIGVAIKSSLALTLNRVNLLGKYMKEQDVDVYYFFLLAKGFYSDTESFSILSQNLSELDRYIIAYFYAELWKEVACK